METIEIGVTAADLKGLAENWVNKSFNMVQLNVYDKMCDDMLYEFIRQPEPNYIEFINNYGLHSEFKSATEEETERADQDTLKEFCEAETSWDTFKDEQRDANYPMWNTLFEFKDEPSEEIIQSAIDAGFGVIEGMDDFNTTLFLSGCGYSFYGAHWIPLFLALPWNSDDKEKFSGVDYSNK